MYTLAENLWIKSIHHYILPIVRFVLFMLHDQLN